MLREERVVAIYYIILAAKANSSNCYLASKQLLLFAFARQYIPYYEQLRRVCKPTVHAVNFEGFYVKGDCLNLTALFKGR